MLILRKTIKTPPILLLLILNLSCSSASLVGVNETKKDRPLEGDLEKAVKEDLAIDIDTEVSKPTINGPTETTSIRLGIGYEDYKDMDYNDGVICFEGEFEYSLTSGQIISLVDQDIDIFVKRNSGAQVPIAVSLESPNGDSRNIFNYTDLGRTEERSLKSISFGKNTLLKVSFGNGDVSLPFASKDQINRVKLEKDHCRTDGH